MQWFIRRTSYRATGTWRDNLSRTALDLNAERYDAPQLHSISSNYLTQWETIYGEGKDEITLTRRFAGVIQRAYEQTGRGVVVLVDEYDKPLLQAINNQKLTENYRQTLKAFYGVLKMPRQNDIIKSYSISFSNSWDSL